ncbi:hypothetical protein STCU_12300 [Strigomonas culicis]|uniref:Uncharacterized protein n=1 Tax=Strigomonas culicis TaxID=28005 RepID=S9UXB2_9TRYP|nr:hypothetical protein STCU_12300 [Strigomonas culicis]|eukprot:EPY15160.1 hypothetical protein STCU_12300 [Strigomonas culicis]
MSRAPHHPKAPLNGPAEPAKERPGTSTPAAAGQAGSRQSSLQDTLSGTTLTDYSLILETSATAYVGLGARDSTATAVRLPPATRPPQPDRAQWRLSSYSPYVFAFMGGVYMDVDVRDALRRTVDCLREDIMKFWSAGGQFTARARQGRNYSQMNASTAPRALRSGPTVTADVTVSVAPVPTVAVLTASTELPAPSGLSLQSPTASGSIGAGSDGPAPPTPQVHADDAITMLPAPVALSTSKDTSFTSSSATPGQGPRARRLSLNPLYYKVPMGASNLVVYHRPDTPDLDGADGSSSSGRRAA